MKTSSAKSKSSKHRAFKLAIVAIVGVFIGLSFFTMHYAEATSYLSNDPTACINCHVMNDHFNGWQQASHKNVATCNDCHVPHDLIGKYLTKIDHGYRHSKGFTFQDFHEPIQIKPSSLRIVNDNCMRCHEALVDGILTSHGGREQVQCVHCHSDAGHGPMR